MIIITYNLDNNYKPVQKGRLNLGAFPAAQRMPAMLPDWQEITVVLKMAILLLALLLTGLRS